MKFVVIAPHPDDELIGCFTLFEKGLVEKVIYINSDTKRGLKAQQLAHKFEFSTEFVNLKHFSSNYRFNSKKIYLVPALTDIHFLHRVVNIITRLKTKRIGYYTTEMNTFFTRVLDKKTAERKRKTLDKYYHDQKSLWQYEWKYFLFEGIIYDLFTSPATS